MRPFKSMKHLLSSIASSEMVSMGDWQEAILRKGKLKREEEEKVNDSGMPTYTRLTLKIRSSGSDGAMNANFTLLVQIIINTCGGGERRGVQSECLQSSVNHGLRLQFSQRSWGFSQNGWKYEHTALHGESTATMFACVRKLLHLFPIFHHNIKK